MQKLAAQNISIKEDIDAIPKYDFKYKDF